MQDESSLTPAQRELERALRSTVPLAGRVDPLAAAFAAGRKSARRQVQVWRSAAVAAMVIGVGAQFLPVNRPPASAPAEFHGPVIAASYQPAPVSDQSVIALQEAVRERGLDGLPAARTPVVHAPRVKEFF